MTAPISACRILFLAGALSIASAANALIFRAYLASDGSDANPCTLAQPCRLLPAALNAVAEGGEIWMLDSANYNTGTVVVTKSVEILAVPGAVGGLVTNGSTALSIASPPFAVDVEPAIRVALRNLRFSRLPDPPFSGGGILINRAFVAVEDCLIANLQGDGIVANGFLDLTMTNTTIRGNRTGIELAGGGGQSATLTRVTISGNSGAGVRVRDGAQLVVDASVFNGNGFRNAEGAVDVRSVAHEGATAHVARSTFHGNSGAGIFVFSDGEQAEAVATVLDSQFTWNNNAGVNVRSLSGTARAAVSNSIFSKNGLFGLRLAGAGIARIWASGNTVTDHEAAILVTGSSPNVVFESAGNNALRNNSNDGGPVTVIPLK